MKKDKTKRRKLKSVGLQPKIKAYRRLWTFNPFDDDPFPSIPHGHSEDNRLKLNVYTGEVIDHNGSIVGKASKKELKALFKDDQFKALVKKAKEYHKQKSGKTVPKAASITKRVIRDVHITVELKTKFFDNADNIK